MTHLTISQAARLAGVSTSTIRRLVKKITTESDTDAATDSDAEHPDRSAITPSSREITRLKQAGEQYTYRISEELIQREFPAPDSATADSASQPGTSSADDQLNGGGELIDLLKDQLTIFQQQLTEKDEQLRRRDKHILELSERVKESHVLQKQLQDHWQLPESNPVTRKPVESTTRRAGDSHKKSYRWSEFFQRRRSKN